MIQIRRLTELDLEQVSKLWRYAFDPHINNFNDLKIEGKEEYLPMTIGAFNNHELCSSMTKLNWTLRFRGKNLQAAAVIAVATFPQYRRSGLIKTLFRVFFKTMNDDSQYLSVLYPFSYSYYEQFGYTNCSDLKMLFFPLSEIKLPVTDQKENNITIKLVDDFKDIRRVYDKASQDFNLIFVRNDDMWKKKETVGSWFQWKGFKFVFYDKNASPVGYVGIKFKKPSFEDEDLELPTVDNDRTNRMNLIEYFWLTEDAKIAIFKFLKDHDSQRKYVQCREISDDIEHYITNLYTLERKTYPGMMVRIINVEEVLKLIEYPQINGTMTFQIMDDYCDWNNKIFTLTVENGKASLLTHDVTSEVDLDFKSDIGSFTQLVSGYFNFNTLVKQGKIQNYSNSTFPNHVFPPLNNLPRDDF
ncbi:MAG: GNAT family N-acetyltransferase [Candidatus Heimdallarchaeota archaeon]|nr:GNAT family N-acetyltransferase [Candidatus Heimdallarchaeota archaeon]